MPQPQPQTREGQFGKERGDPTGRDHRLALLLLFRAYKYREIEDRKLSDTGAQTGALIGSITIAIPSSSTRRFITKLEQATLNQQENASAARLAGEHSLIGERIRLLCKRKPRAWTMVHVWCADRLPVPSEQNGH